MRSYNENSDVGYFLEVDIDYPKQLWRFHKDIPYLSEERKLEKLEKLVCSMEDKEKYDIHVKALKHTIIKKSTMEWKISESIEILS